VYADPTGRIDVKTTVEGSVGFLTETSACDLDAHRPLRHAVVDVLAGAGGLHRRPDAGESLGMQREVYFFAGARFTARAYNAFLQGQFRESDVRYSYSRSSRSSGMPGRRDDAMFANTEVSYALHYQTAELRDGDASRNTFWGGVQLAHSF
jgi:hypothetical protein